MPDSTPASARTVLLIGSSSFVYTEWGEDRSEFEMIKRNLSQQRPDITWTCILAFKDPVRSLAETCVDATREHNADVVVLSMAATPSAQEFVVHRIRRRWPRVYGLALKATQRLKELAGGDAEQGRSPRRLIYQLPEWLAITLIGGEPAIPPEFAIANTSRALASLSAMEHVTVICRLGAGTPRGPKARKQRYAARVGQVNAAVAAECERRHIRSYSPLAEMRRQGLRPQDSSDGIHLDLAFHEFGAQRTAQLILEELGLAEGVPAALEAVAN